MRSLSRPDDITPIAAAEYIRANVSRFFPSGRFTAGEAVGQLVVEALLGGAQSIDVRRVERWWVVGGDVDWLPSPLDEEAFHALVPFPEAGPNAARREILLNVFAADVAAGGVDGPRVIKGQIDEDVKSILAASDYQRSIAFRE